MPQAGWAPRLVHGEAVRQVNLLAPARRAAPPRLHGRRRRSTSTSADVTDAVRRLGARLPARARSGSGSSRSDGRRPGFELGAGPFTVRAVRLQGPGGDALAGRRQPELHLRPRAGRPRAGHRRARPAADPAPQREVARLPRRARRSCARCAQRLHCERRRRAGRRLGARRRTPSPRSTRSACATSTPTQGVPNETRQPFRRRLDRLRAHPARARPHVPGHRQPADARSRASASSGCAPALPPPPWEREARYAAAGVPAPTVHYLIRRGGAAPRRPRRRRGRRRPPRRLLLLRRAAQGAAPRRASRSTRCRRALGRAVPPGRRAAGAAGGLGRAGPADGRRVRTRASRRSSPRLGSVRRPRAGRQRSARSSTTRARRRRAARRRRRRERLAAGRRDGRRCAARSRAADVVAAVRARPRRWAMSETPRRAEGLQGPRPRRARRAWGVRVWSEVRLTNDAGSVFEGVILPRRETLDDQHVVVKLKNGYNVGIHVDRVARDRGARLQGSDLQDPREGVPGPAEPARA